MKIQIKPTIKQALAWEKLLDRITKFIVFGGGAGGGKSWLGCEWLLSNCLAYPGTKWFIGREELKRLMGSSYVTFLKVCSHHKVPKSYWKLNGQYNFIQFANGSRIDLLDLKYLPSDPLYERLGSLEYTGGWIEEGGEVHFDAFDTLKSRIGRHLNREYNIMSKMLVTCNPKKNWLYINVYKPWRDKILPKVFCFIQSLYNDNPYTAEEYGDNLNLIQDISKKKRLMLGIWEYVDDPALLFDYDAVTDIFTTNLIAKRITETEKDYTERIKKIPKYLTVDVAGRGKDKTVLVYWIGLQIYKIEMLDNISSHQLIDRLDQHNIMRSHCIIDEDGVGFGLVKDTSGVKGFVNGGSPIKTKQQITKYEQNYANLKSQCWFHLANMVNNGLIGCYKEVSPKPKGLLIEDLEVMKQSDDSMQQDKKLAVIKKPDVKDILGRSTDLGDAVMMRMMPELKPKTIVL